MRSFSLAVQVLILALVTLGIGCKKGKKACTPGERGCECAVGATCEDGLTCEQGTCSSLATLSLDVLDKKARGCEVLVEDQDRVVDVVFSSAVQGTFVREAPRTAISFIATEDRAIPRDSVEIRYMDEGKGPPEVKVSNCTDPDGNMMDDSEVELGG